MAASTLCNAPDDGRKLCPKHVFYGWHFVVFYGVHWLVDVLSEDATVYVQQLGKDVHKSLPSLPSHSSQSL